jgi:cell division septal protein FtsQ
MWGRRKRKNRCFERSSVLQVKLRSKQVRAMRLRWIGTALAILLGSAFTVLVAWRGSEWVVSEFVYKNRAFAVQQIDIQTDGVLSSAQIQHWTGVHRSDNLLAIDLARVKRDLELIPAIHSAAVDRVLPGTLRVRVSEREPIAQITAFHGRSFQTTVFHLDAEGYVLWPAPRGTNTPQETLPGLIGVTSVELRIGARVDSPRILSALGFVQQFNLSPMAAVSDLQIIDLALGDVMRVTTRHGNEITFPRDSFELALRRWRAVHELGHQSGKAILTMDLSVANNVPVRWLDASATPPELPKSQKPSRYRKKNV